MPNTDIKMHWSFNKMSKVSHTDERPSLNGLYNSLVCADN